MDAVEYFTVGIIPQGSSLIIFSHLVGPDYPPDLLSGNAAAMEPFDIIDVDTRILLRLLTKEKALRLRK